MSGRVRDVWESWSADHKRAAIRAAVNRVIVNPIPPGGASNPARSAYHDGPHSRPVIVSIFVLAGVYARLRADAREA